MLRLVRQPKMLIGLMQTMRQILWNLMVFIQSLAIALPAPLSASFLLPAASAYASSYQQGNASYQKGDFQGAVKALKAALNKKPSREESAKIMKLMGICQFMLGNKQQAATSFKQALSLDPQTKITEKEVLDPAVISFFNGQKHSDSHAPATKNKPPQTAAAPAKAKSSPAAAPKAAPAPAAPGKAASAAAPKKTYLRINSNVQATVLLDGILAGQTNSLINSEGGDVEVLLQASGYISRKAKIKVAANRENVVTINLSKPKPKPKPAPKPVPKPSATVAQAKTPSAAKGNSSRPAHKENDLFAPPPGDTDFSLKGAPAQGRPPAVGPDLATEFEMDSRGGMPPAPGGSPYGGAPSAAPYGYAPPPGYGSPPPTYYAPPPTYYAPPPTYYAPPPTYYAPPPTYYAPPPTYYAPPAAAAPPAVMDPAPPAAAPPPPPSPADVGYDAPPTEDYMYPADPARGAKNSRRKNNSARNSKSKPASSKNMFITLLPFGAGQFQNKDTLKGLLFLGAEAGALGYWYMKNQAAAEAVKQTNAYTASVSADQLQNDPQFAAQYNEFIAKRGAYVKELRQNAQYGLIGFGALWVIGVAEAIMNAPTGTPKNTNTRKYKSFAASDGEASDEAQSQLDKNTPRRYTAFDWNVSLSLPALAMQPSENAGSISSIPIVFGDNAAPLSLYDNSLRAPAALSLELRWSF